MRNFFSGTIGSIVLMAALGLGVYFGNVELQSYWGRQAIAQTGLEIHTLSDAIAIARSEDKKIFVDVSAVWCGTCRKLDNEVFANENVKKVLNEDYVFSRLEYESSEGQKFINERNIKGFPNLWILDKDGNNIRRLRVLFDPEEFVAQLR